jgi:hypothetical protein
VTFTGATHVCNGSKITVARRASDGELAPNADVVGTLFCGGGGRDEGDDPRQFIHRS